MPTEVMNPLVAQGVLGIFCFILLGTVAKLWSDCKTKDQLINAQHELRITELKTIIPVATRGHENTELLTSAMTERGRADAAGIAAITALKDQVTALKEHIATITKELERRPT